MLADHIKITERKLVEKEKKQMVSAQPSEFTSELY